MIGLVIPIVGPLLEVRDDPTLKYLQKLVGGHIEAVPLPEFIGGADRSTAYVNEEGKFDPDCLPNMRATDFMVPGIGLQIRDHIAGTFVLCGFDPQTGEHADLPQPVIDRARLIEREAAWQFGV